LVGGGHTSSTRKKTPKMGTLKREKIRQKKSDTDFGVSRLRTFIGCGEKTNERVSRVQKWGKRAPNKWYYKE